MAINYDRGSETVDLDYSEHYSMIEKVAKQLIFNVDSVNPLAWIKKGRIENGVAIEQAVVQLTDSYAWTDNPAGNAPDYLNSTLRPVDGGTTKSAYPTFVARYFDEWNGKQFKAVVSDSQIRKVLLSGKNVDEISQKVVANLTESEGYEDYIAMKALLADGITGGNIIEATATPVGADLITLIKDIVNQFQFVNGEYLGATATNPDFKTRTPLDRIRLIMPYTVFNKLSVDVWATLFNLEKAEILNKITLIDEGTKVYIVDEYGLLSYDRVYKMTSKYIEDKLLANYWLTVDRMYGTSGLFKMAYIETAGAEA